MQTVGQYQIQIYNDPTYRHESADNLHNYDFDYFKESEYIFPTIFGIKVLKDDQLLKSAVIGSVGGGTTNHENSTIIEADRVLICCSDTVFCLSIPELNLIWRTQADQGTCFEIFGYQESYIIHGEFEISRLSKNGDILWKQSGADIFVTLEGKNDFKLTEKFIIAKDFENRVYKFDYEGNDYSDQKIR